MSPSDANMLVARLQGHQSGFAFAIPVAEGDDVHVAPEAMADAMHNDIVLVEKMRQKKRRGRRGAPQRLGPSGRVVRVLRHANTQLVGRYVAGTKGGHVAPDDPRIAHDVYVAPERNGGAAGGDMVQVRITSWPHAAQGGRGPDGEIVRVLGKEGAPGVDVQSVAIQFDLPQDFSAKALRAAAQVPTVPTHQDRRGRRDLRRQPTLAIDPEDARDRDDALSLDWDERTGRRIVMVHIADVSHYVRPEGALDLQARLRGCTVYLVSDFVPMLPRDMTQQALSFAEGQDRLAKTVVLEFDGDGELATSSICHSVVNVDHAMSYEDVRAILDAADGAADEAATRARDAYPPETCDLVCELDKLARQLKARRRETGSVDLDMTDFEVRADEDGRVAAVNQIERDRAHGLVEEFMLSANCAVARFAQENRLPVPYRVHAEPEPETLQEFAEFVLTATGKQVDPTDRKALQGLLASVTGTDMADTINMQLLRSMKRAVYAPHPRLHYALHFQPYCHFTSPIRRYPDLVVHQVLDQYFVGKLASDSVSAGWKEKLPQICHACGQAEQRADEAEREIIKLKMLRYIKDRPGAMSETFDGVITGVQEYGFFAQLQGLPVEGLVAVRALGSDIYRLDEKSHALIGSGKGEVLGLGMPVRVRIADIDMARRTMDLLLARGEQ